MMFSSKMLWQCLLLLHTAANAIAEDSWSFIVLADWHGSESYAVNPVNDTFSNNTYYDDTLKVLTHINQKYGGDLVILPGDTNNGKWYQKYVHELLNYYLGLESLTNNEAIAIAGKNCYSTMKRVFSKAGYDKVLLALGDHELGGDGWKIDSDKVKGLPYFRDSLVRELNEKDGVPLYTTPIGDAASRPYGTEYEQTSYAHVHKNALFVTVDAFHSVNSTFFDRETGEGGNGIVTCTVVGEHYLWFEDVLRAGQEDPSIKYMFVQAHIPILQPVRKINSSGQFMDGGENSDFWKAMQKYGVNVYFAGEVHANTVIKDPNSNVIQISSRANRLSNFLKVEVSDEEFEIKAYNEFGENWRWNGQYTQYGLLNVRKPDDQLSITSDGALEVFDPSGPLIWLKFDQSDTYSLKDWQIIGLKYDQFQQTLLGHSVTIRNKTSTIGMSNFGAFGHQYDAQIANINFNENGRGAIFEDTSRMAIGSMGPLAAGDIISCSLHFKTTQSNNEMILTFYGGKFGQSVSKDLFLLTLKNGSPRLHFNKKTLIEPKTALSLDEGSWHNIIITMPSKSCLYSQMKIIVDGEEVPTVLQGQDKHIFFTTSGLISLGGWGYSNEDFGDKVFDNLINFSGEMSDFRVWHGKSIDASALHSEAPSTSPTIPAIRTISNSNIDTSDSRNGPQCGVFVKTLPVMIYFFLFR